MTTHSLQKLNSRIGSTDSSSIMRSKHVPLRVLMISVRADHGGGPRHIELLLRHLPNDIEPFIACPDELPYRERFSRLVEAPVYTIPHRHFSLGSSLGLAAYARHQGIDVIHAHGKGAGVYARSVSFLTGKPVVHTPHGVHALKYRRVLRGAYRFYENTSARWVNHVIFVSEEERAAASYAGLWPRTSNCVIVNGVEDVPAERVASQRSATRARLGIAENKLLVATIAGFEYQKNMQEAYAVAKALPDIQFLWIGDGNEAAELKRRAKAEKVDNLSFLGNLDDPSPMLAAADVYFTTSRGEGLPLAVLEAMAMRLPVVASNVTGHRELVGEYGGGLLYPLGDPDQAVVQLGQLATDQALRRSLGERGCEVQRRHYSSRSMTAAVCDVYWQIALTFRTSRM